MKTGPKRLGRPIKYGGNLTSFTPGERLTQLIAEVQKQLRLHKLPILTQSFIFRKGAFAFCQKLLKDTQKAKNGVLHAKMRKDEEVARPLLPIRRAGRIRTQHTKSEI